MKETVVVSLGGSVLYSKEKFDSEKVKKICGIMAKASRKFGLVIVVGGGPLARKKVDKVRAGGGSEFQADTAAIGATRENALKTSEFLENSVFVKEFQKAPGLLEKGKTVVSGGMTPGITTDTVAVLFAEVTGAKRLVNVSSVGGIYCEDPRKNPDARLFRKLSHDKLVALAVKSDSRKARENFVFDLVACKLAARSKIRLDFVSADAGDLENALLGKKHSGTVVG